MEQTLNTSLPLPILAKPWSEMKATPMPLHQPDFANRQSSVERRWDTTPPPAVSAWATPPRPASDRPYGDLAANLRQVLSGRRGSMPAVAATQDPILRAAALQMSQWRNAAMSTLAGRPQDP